MAVCDILTAMNIRLATTEDFPGAYALWQRAKLWVRSIAEERDRFASCIQRNPKTCFVMLDETQEIVGIILGLFDGRTVFVSRLTVDPKYQRQGYGAQLMQHLEAEVKKRGMHRIEVRIHESNAEVVQFYESQGYTHDPLIVLQKNLSK